MAVFSYTRPTVRVRVLPRFPARVTGDGGISATYSGGLLTLSLAYDTLLNLTSIDVASNYDVAVRDVTTGEYRNIDLGVLIAELSASIGNPPGLNGLSISTVRKSQFMRALENTGLGRYNFLKAAVSGIPPGDVNFPALIAFEMAAFVTPGDTLANFTKSAIGFTDSGMTDLFTAAAAIND